MRTPLERTRLVACLVSSGVVGGHLWLLRSDPSSIAALILLLALVVLTYRRGRSVPGEPLLAPVLLVIIGTGLPDPSRVLNVTIAVYATLALYGSTRAWAIRTLLGLAVLPGSVALAATDHAWHSAEVLSLVPFVLPVGLVMRNICRILTQHEVVSQRDRLLSTAGTRFLAAADVEQVRAIGAELSARMLELTPDTVMMVVARDPDGLRVLRNLGMERSVRGELLPPEAITDPLSHFAGLVPHVRHWHVEPSADRYLLLGGIRRVPEDVVVAFRNLVHQVVLAETSRRTLDELRHRAHHDDLTQLANRELFGQRLAAATAGAAPGSVALCTIDLDDFKQVNDTLGHAAGDELLIEVARRLRDAAGSTGTAARLGGDEFALLLTGLSGPGEATARAAEVSARLQVPVLLGRAMRPVGASIGVATTSVAVSTEELLRRADAAMYSAKAAGKNRVEFTDGPPTDGPLIGGHHAPPERSGSGSPAPAWSGSATRTP
ncbi:GGDEF domain-containing protein [Actinoplanes sp. NPDC051633]|uniref:GGDEF domain-containing protein n=1 Tax=Actinoplanes sp. NPDC051633 TaxID=3155670 RepID=UPI0034156244